VICGGLQHFNDQRLASGVLVERNRALIVVVNAQADAL